MNGSCIWITGAGGLIGHYLAQTAPAHAPDHRVVGWTRDRLELTDRPAVQRAFSEDPPSAIIHCAALSRSTVCERNPALARTINVEVTRCLAELAADIPFVFFSTDLVFDGQQGMYDEQAAVNPLSVYAATKVEAEKLVLKNPRHLVIRTSLNGGTSPSGDRGFNEEFRLACSAGRTLNLFTDEFRCPIPALITAQATRELLLAGCRGIYHLAGSERLSRWDIGQALAERWPELHPRLNPASLRTYQGAPRSPDTSLNCARAQKVLSFSLPGFRSWLKANPEIIF